MPVVEFTQETMPETCEEFSQRLEELQRNSDPLDDLLALSRQLLSFEQEYSMSSDEFYAKYKRGEMGDDIEFIRWSGYYRLYHELKDKIEKSLEMVITERAAVPA
jgi:hypothetical protein